MQLEITLLKQLMCSRLEQTGLPKNDASEIVNALLDAECSGVLSHGLMRFPIYMKQFRDGTVSTAPEIRLTQSGNIFHVDGGNGSGIVVTRRAMSVCIDHAKKSGICAAAISHSNHFGAAAYYSRMAAKAECIGFACSMAGATMAPYGGKELLLGTDPFSIAFPYGENIFAFDAASSATAKGKIRVYAEQGKNIPAGWALDKDGHPTTDAKKAIDGILLPMGGHKGYGIALAVEMLSALLSGVRLSCETQSMFDVSKAANIGHFIAVIDISHFLPPEEFKARAGAWLGRIAGSEPCDTSSVIVIPGTPEEKCRREHEQCLEIDDALYQKIMKA